MISVDVRHSLLLPNGPLFQSRYKTIGVPPLLLDSSQRRPSLFQQKKSAVLFLSRKKNQRKTKKNTRHDKSDIPHLCTLLLLLVCIGSQLSTFSNLCSPIRCAFLFHFPLRTLMVVITCNPLEAPDNGSISGDCGSVLGSVCTVACNVGHVVGSGTVERTCTKVSERKKRGFRKEGKKKR